MIFWKIRLALVDFFFKSFYPLIDTLVGLAVFVHFINGESDEFTVYYRYRRIKSISGRICYSDKCTAGIF